MLHFILIYLCRILIFMYIFGYFFQKGQFKCSSKKEHINKKYWGARQHPPPIPAPSAPEGLFQGKLIKTHHCVVLAKFCFRY